MTSLLLAVLLSLGFSTSDCTPGHLDALYEDTSFTVTADSQSMVCVDDSTPGYTEVLAYTAYDNGQWIATYYGYQDGQAFPESVDVYHWAGSWIGGVKEVR